MGRSFPDRGYCSIVLYCSCTVCVPAPPGVFLPVCRQARFSRAMRNFILWVLVVSSAAFAPGAPSHDIVRVTRIIISHGRLTMAATPELTVCQGSVCSKHGTKAVQAAARKSGFQVKVTSTCLKGCGKGVNVSAKGIGKKMLKDCTDAAKAQAATDALAKKV